MTQADDRSRLSALRPWALGFGVVGVISGLLLLWATPAGWAVFATGAIGVLLGVFTPRLQQFPPERVRWVVIIGFLVFAGWLVRRSSEDLHRGSVGSAVLGFIGVLCGLYVGLGGIASEWARIRFEHGKEDRFTRFFSRYWDRD